MIEQIKVDFKTLEKIYFILKDRDTKEVTFEFLVGSCFPNVMNNIKAEMRYQYTLGYHAGQISRENN